jgi:hypothetical protein
MTLSELTHLSGMLGSGFRPSAIPSNFILELEHEKGAENISQWYNGAGVHVSRLNFALCANMTHRCNYSACVASIAKTVNLKAFTETLDFTCEFIDMTNSNLS